MTSYETCTAPGEVRAGIPPFRDFYDPSDFTQAEVETELARVYQETAIERQWFNDQSIKRFPADADIGRAVQRGALEKVDPMTGIMPIWNLRNHPNAGYSPPYLRQRAAHALEYVGQEWAAYEGYDEVGVWYLAATSLVRSTRYQERISRPKSSQRAARKIAIRPSPDHHSSHEYGFAFDLDARGLYLQQDGQPLTAVNSTQEHPYDDKVARGRDTLRTILGGLQLAGYVNVCEELPDTHQWCFHVCVNPQVSASDILFGLRLQEAV